MARLPVITEEKADSHTKVLAAPRKWYKSGGLKM